MDLIVTQAVCEVCAVSFDDVRAVAERLPTQPEVISLDPSTLGEVLADVPRLARGGRRRGGRRASSPRRPPSGSRPSSGRVEDAPRPRVAALEWLDPVYVGGHWVPQMIELAGGEDVLGLPGEKSRTAEWAELEALAPEVVVSMPCGYYAEQAAAETMQAARAARRRSAPAWSRSTPRPTSRARARGSWRASSCSATCSTPSSCRRRRRAARSSWTSARLARDH